MNRVARSSHPTCLRVPVRTEEDRPKKTKKKKKKKKHKDPEPDPDDLEPHELDENFEPSSAYVYRAGIQPSFDMRSAGPGTAQLYFLQHSADCSSSVEAMHDRRVTSC